MTTYNRDIYRNRKLSIGGDANQLNMYDATRPITERVFLLCPRSGRQ